MKSSLLFVMMAVVIIGRADLTLAQTTSASSVSLKSSFMHESTASSLPLFYKSLVPFSSTEHAKLTFPNKLGNYSFAAATDIVPLLVSEIPRAVRHYPIVFIKDKATSIVTPVALVGRGDGKNRFVEDNGQWRSGVYVPAWVRRYPFALMAGPNGEVMLALDTKAEVFADKRDGHPLFGDDGKPTELFQKIIEFQKEFQGLWQLTERVTQALVQADVLEDAGLSILQPGSDKPLNVQGFMTVNERKLKALSAGQLEQLMRADALGLAYAQLLSMGNFSQVMGVVDASNKLSQFSR